MEIKEELIGKFPCSGYYNTLTREQTFCDQWCVDGEWTTMPGDFTGNTIPYHMHNGHKICPDCHCEITQIIEASKEEKAASERAKIFCDFIDRISNQKTRV